MSESSASQSEASPLSIRSADESIIELHMVQAFRGDRKAAADFFEALYSIELVVPERYTNPQLVDSTIEYPHPFLNILAYREDERTCVPVFTGETTARQFSDPPPLTRRLPGKDLFALLPEHWWIVVNPTSDVAKELSPWELDMLRCGKERIPEIVSEVFAGDTPSPMCVGVPTILDFPTLKRELVTCCSADKRVRKAFLLHEKAPDSSESSSSDGLVPLIGIVVFPQYANNEEDLLEHIRTVANEAQGTGAKPRIFIGTEESPSMMLKRFLGTEPVYESEDTGADGSSKWGVPFFLRAFR